MRETPAVTEVEPEDTPRRRLVESTLDNLSMWAFVALATSFLFLVWATIEILNKYVGEIPGVAP